MSEQHSGNGPTTGHHAFRSWPHRLVREERTTMNAATTAPKLTPGTIDRLPQGEGGRIAEGGKRCGHAAAAGEWPAKQPLISIVTVVLNNEAGISRCIESVKAQEYTPIEHIIIDGGSTDGTLEIIASHSEALDYYVSEKDGGIYDAMNKGLSLARGDYILLLNSDEWLEVNAIKAASALFNTMAEIICLPQRKLREDMGEIGIFGLRFFDERTYLRIPMPHLCLIASRAYKRLGGYRSTYKLIADWDFYIRAYEAGMTAVSVKSQLPLTNYVRAGASAGGGDSSHPIYAEQIRLLHERFPLIKDKDLLFILSSRMEECSSEQLRESLAAYHAAGGILPETIEKAIKLYSEQRFGEVDAGIISQTINHGKDLRLQHEEIQKLLTNGIKQETSSNRIWIINERGHDAQDNGYAFFEYLCKAKPPDISIYYVISEKSKDFTRISGLIDRSKILEPNSPSHKKIYLHAQYVLSSQGGDHCHPFNHRMLAKYYPENTPRFGFLQHGILKDEIDYFHKGVFNHNFFVISGAMERALMTELYNYPESDLICSGLPRFDLLKSGKHGRQTIIAFLPTWRSFLTSAQQLIKSDYLSHIKSVANSKEIESLLRKHRLKLQIYIHPNYRAYHDVFKQGLTCDPDLVTIQDCDYSYSELQETSCIAITDYSSAIIDFALIGTPVIYFQPDHDEFRSRHYGKTPYFNYQEHGLGKVCDSTRSLVDEIETIIANKYKVDSRFRRRRKYLYSFADHNNCSRLLEGINNKIESEQHWHHTINSWYESLETAGPVRYEVRSDSLFIACKVHDNRPTDMFKTIEIALIDYIGRSKRLTIEPMESGTIYRCHQCTIYLCEINITTIAEICIGDHQISTQDKQNQRLRILHMSAMVRGGAANATDRLNQALNRTTGVSSTVLTHVSHQEGLKNMIYVGDYEERSINEGVRRFFESVKKDSSTILYSPSCFYTPLSQAEILQLITHADIVNLHWTPTLLSIEDIGLILSLGKPVVWTIHDTYPLAGGCHYFHGCDKWKYDCTDCPHLTNTQDQHPSKYLAAKREIFSAASNLTIVTLNQHFYHIAKQSRLFKHCRIEIIPNSIDTDKYYPRSHQEACIRQGLDSTQKHILYAANYASKSKGYHELAEAINILSQEPDWHEITVLIAGDIPSNPNLRVSAKYLGEVDTDTMIDLYSVADVAVVSSLEDNLPNIVLEALACGTPLAAFKVGGIPDLIKEGYNGFLAETGNAKELSCAIKRALCCDRSMSKRCRNYALNHLSFHIQAERYKLLYQDLHAKKGAVNTVMQPGLISKVRHNLSETRLKIVTQAFTSSPLPSTDTSKDILDQWQQRLEGDRRDSRLYTCAEEMTIIASRIGKDLGAMVQRTDSCSPSNLQEAHQELADRNLQAFVNYVANQYEKTGQSFYADAFLELAGQIARGERQVTNAELNMVVKKGSDSKIL